MIIPMKTILLTFLLFLPTIILGKVEYNSSIEVLSRSFPFGAFSKFSYEGIFPIWGNREHSKDIKYGFAGAKGEIRSSALVNYISGNLFIYPIPILGFYLGQETGLKNIKKIDTFDCNLNNCRGKMNRSFAGIKLALAYKDFFLLSDNRWSEISTDNSEKYFVDEMTSLLGSPEGDQSFISLNLFGINYNETNRFGIIYLKNKMKFNQSDSSMTNFFYDYSWEKNNSLISSIGVFKTRKSQNVGTLLFLYRWRTPSEFRLF